MKAFLFKMLMLASVLNMVLLPDASCENHPSLATHAEAGLIQALKEAHIRQYAYQVLSAYPHDSKNFTEGLCFENGFLYESTGLYGQSSLRKIELKTGKLIKAYPLPAHYFGEGLTLLHDQLYQLSYREQEGFVYDKNSLQLENQFSFPNEGWGLANDGRQLMMSDGSATITYLDPVSFKAMRTLTVTAGHQKINRINELEYIEGLIYANVFPTSILLMISPQTGKVQGFMNISSLKPHLACLECVANGIAYDEQDKVIYVTGKNWPYLYGIKVI